MADEAPKKRKRPIHLPARRWPALPNPEVGDDAAEESDPSGSQKEKGLAGADDIVEWLALLMNEKEVSYEELSSRSGVAVRTIKKWFDNDLAKRTIPNLQTIQACLEALGYSLIPAGPSVLVDETTRYLPLEQFRRSLLLKRLEQGAKHRGTSVEEHIEDQESRFKEGVARGRIGPRRRIL